MISVQTTLSVLDNSDAIFVKCIHLFGGSYRRYSNLGDLIFHDITFNSQLSTLNSEHAFSRF